MRLRIFYRWRGYRAFRAWLRTLPPVVDALAPETEAEIRRRLEAAVKVGVR